MRDGGTAARKRLANSLAARENGWQRGSPRRQSPSQGAWVQAQAGQRSQSPVGLQRQERSRPAGVSFSENHSNWPKRTSPPRPPPKPCTSYVRTLDLCPGLTLHLQSRQTALFFLLRTGNASRLRSAPASSLSNAIYASVLLVLDPASLSPDPQTFDFTPY